MSAVETIQRALKLAADGKHRSIEDIRRSLVREKHERIDGHLSGPSIRAQLKALILKAHGET